MLNLTPVLRPRFARRVRASHGWYTSEAIRDTQLKILEHLLHQAANTEYGTAHNFERLRKYTNYAAEVQPAAYPEYRALIERMVHGEPDILWPGVCRRFAQSSGTSDGKSKFIPVTDDSLNHNHYKGAADVVAHYLHLNPESKIFSGQSFILGGSFANEIKDLPPGVKVGDLSANLIDHINPAANLLRVPDKDVALMTDWTKKLPALVEASLHEDITNISGVPSWFLTVLRKVISRAGANTIHDVWPNLEVFFHGGIAFGPYREQYRAITDPSKMHYLETYNASEGFFAVQDCIDNTGMLLLLDCGVFYEFIPAELSDSPDARPIPAWEVEQGRIYEMIITSCNGLWRYRIGDTVKIQSTAPLRITIAGRTKSFINAFGEELMVHNADAAISEACRKTGAAVLNYTAAPVYDDGGHRGRHQWLIEWATAPHSVEEFADILDIELQRQNSDYQAKRSGNIFLDRLSIVTARHGLFDEWLASTGKLGGQRKVPRLSNSRQIIDTLLKYNEN